MKHLYFMLLVASLLTACGPSSEQITATAMMAQAQTQTAVPTQTLTPTSTATATSLPTATATATRELVVIEISGLSLDTIYYSEDLGLTFQYPSSWEVINASEMGGAANEIVVMEDYDKVMDDYINLTFSAINFSISQRGAASANDVVNEIPCNLEAGEPITRAEVINGQNFLWVECKGFVNVDGQPLFNVFTGISNGHTSVLASTMIKSSSVETIRPIYEAIVRTIILP